VTLPDDLAAHPRLDTWVRLTEGETVTLYTGKVELGQGLLSAIARLGAEELDVSLSRVRVRTGDTAHALDEWLTAGSMSMTASGTALRQAAAEARAALLALAAERLGAPAAELVVQDGTVLAPGGGRITYWELVPGGRLEGEATGAAVPKAPADYRVVGHRGARVDMAAHATGTARFVGDLHEPGMLHARVVRGPGQGARLENVDGARVEALPGVVAVVRDGDFLAVVAEGEDQALRAHDALSAAAQWREDAGLPDQTTLPRWLLEQPAQSYRVIDGTPDPDAPTAPLDPGTGTHPAYTATFSRPFLMHGSIGPSAALAEWTDGALHVRSHTQGPFILRDALARALRVDPEAIRVEHVPGPGCYGHNGADDVALDAALAARAVRGRPVLLKWTRAEEHAFEPYGAPGVVRVEAHLDDHGGLADWSADVRGLTHLSRPLQGMPGSGLLAAWTLSDPVQRTPALPMLVHEGGIHRNATPAYRIPRTRIVKHFVDDGPLRTSSLRSLGAHLNVFANESAMDELALLAGRDPLAFRLDHLDDERARAVLAAAAERAGWAHRADEPGRGMGLAYAQYKNKAGYVAVVVTVRVDDATAAVTLERAVIAADAGQVVDPAGLVNQLEGGLVQSASWTLHERVAFDRTRVTSLDWDSYPILRFPEVPAIETVLIDRPGEPFLGSGEATQGPTAAAIGNAIRAATGVRVHDLPITPERLRRAAAEPELAHR
jgi:nicotinate dehydrogenase subunit B